MKYFFALVTILILSSCSFDNKTNIWKKENQITSKNDELFKEFKNISVAKSTFSETINLDKNYKFEKVKILKTTSGQIFIMQ